MVEIDSVDQNYCPFSYTISKMKDANGTQGRLLYIAEAPPSLAIVTECGVLREKNHI